MKILFSSLCLLTIFMSCAAQNETNSYQQILQNIRTILNVQNGTNSYQQILQNIRTVLNTFGNVNQTSLIQAAQLINQVNDVIDIQQVVGAISNFSSILNDGSLVGTTPKCLNDTSSISPGVQEGKDWALRLVDAAGKPPPGLMNFKLNWFGDYEECVAVQADDFSGQYCLTTFWIVAVQNPLTQTPGITAKIGLCLPDSCTEADGLSILNAVVPEITNKQVYVTELKCQEPNKPYDTKAIISLSVISVFVLVMIIATAYDVIINHFIIPRKGNNSKERKYAHTEEVNNKVTKIEYEPDQKDGNEMKQNDNTTNTINDPENGTKTNNVDRKSNVDQSSAESTGKKIKPGILGQLLLSFSIYTNVPKILSTRQGTGTLTAVNGIRFISMTWVILGHTFAFGLLNGGIGNVATAYPIFLARKSFMAIMNAEVSVDTFFALSGTLLTYVVLKQLKKEKGKLNWFMFYFHRVWRLTPPYMLIIMVYIPLFPYLGSGPMWAKDGTELNYCKDSWWYNLLYINNFRTVGEQCFAWAWYLANDMQFYVLSPIIILPLFFSKLAGTIVITVFLIGTTITAGVISQHYELDISSFGRNGVDYFDQYYQRPYCRMGPYLVGMYTGYMLYKTKCRTKINWYLNILLWAVFTSFACLVLYGVYDDFNGKPMSVDVAALYNAVHKTVWGAAVCWVIFACATGNGGFINTILSWKVFIPLGRLTYCAYLVHPIIQYYYYGSRKELQYWDDHEIIYEYLGHLVLSYAAAFIASLAFESPMMALEKIVFKR